MAIGFREQVAAKTNEELLDIYVNSGEYQEEFIKFVTTELIKRNVNVDQTRQVKEEREHLTKEQFETGREGNEVYIVLCFVSAVLGGFIGIIGGYVYSQSKHRDSSGTKYYVYNKRTREKGRIMMIIGLFAFAFLLAWKFT